MDADTRHQLKQNELAEALTKLRDLNNPNTRFAILVLVVLVVGYFGVRAYRYYRHSAQEGASAKLGEISAALHSDDAARASGAMAEMRSLIDSTGNVGVKSAARLELARAYFDKAVDDPNSRTENLKQAGQLYDAILKQSSTPAAFEATALFGAAGIHESLREFDQAKAKYEKLADKKFDGSPYQKLAAVRLSSLADIQKPLALAPGTPPEQPAMPSGLPPGVQLMPVTPEEAAKLNQAPVTPAAPPTPPAPAQDAPTPEQPAPTETPATPAPAPEQPQNP